jgi:hypothetical protein
MQLAIDFCLAHTPRDQLRVLRAKIQDQNFLMRHVRLRTESFEVRKKAATRAALPMASS